MVVRLFGRNKTQGDLEACDGRRAGRLTLGLDSFGVTFVSRRGCAGKRRLVLVSCSLITEEAVGRPGTLFVRGQRERGGLGEEPREGNRDWGSLMVLAMLAHVSDSLIAF